jgi:hypothetical protein
MLLATAAAVSLAGLLAQGKALPYQRYPFLAFLLGLMATDLATAWSAGRPGSTGTPAGATTATGATAATGARRAAAWTGLAGLAAGVLVLAPLSLARVHRFVARPEAMDALLTADLLRLNDPGQGPGQGSGQGNDLGRIRRGRLSGRVQCLDSIEDCLAVLDRLELLPATPVLGDQALLDPRPLPAVALVRRRFLAAVADRPPLVIVVVSGYALETADGYRKLDRWPALAAWLTGHYTLVAERRPPGELRWWSRPRPQPGYRLYVLRGTPVAPEGAPR